MMFCPLSTFLFESNKYVTLSMDMPGTSCQPHIQNMCPVSFLISVLLELLHIKLMISQMWHLSEWWNNTSKSISEYISYLLVKVTFQSHLSSNLFFNIFLPVRLYFWYEMAMRNSYWVVPPSITLRPLYIIAADDSWLWIDMYTLWLYSWCTSQWLCVFYPL